MSARSLANGLLKPSRDLLLAHLDGQPRPLAIGPESYSRNALVDRRLLRFDDNHSLKPHSTIITELGREVLCTILGDYADALVRAGCLDKAPPIKLVRNAPTMVPPLAGREADMANVMAGD